MSDTYLLSLTLCPSARWCYELGPLATSTASPRCFVRLLSNVGCPRVTVLQSPGSMYSAFEKFIIRHTVSYRDSSALINCSKETFLRAKTTWLSTKNSQTSYLLSMKGALFVQRGYSPFLANPLNVNSAIALPPTEESVLLVYKCFFTTFPWKTFTCGIVITSTFINENMYNIDFSPLWHL